MEPHFDFIQKRKQNVFQVNLETDEHTKFLPELNIIDAIASNGSTWCLCEVEGKYSAVRLNSINNRVEKRIDLSIYVNRPWAKLRDVDANK